MFWSMAKKKQKKSLGLAGDVKRVGHQEGCKILHHDSDWEIVVLGRQSPRKQKKKKKEILNIMATGHLLGGLVGAPLLPQGVLWRCSLYCLDTL